jgi:hypothetical protein
MQRNNLVYFEGYIECPYLHLLEIVKKSEHFLRVILICTFHKLMLIPPHLLQLNRIHNHYYYCLQLNKEDLYLKQRMHIDCHFYEFDKSN